MENVHVEMGIFSYNAHKISEYSNGRFVFFQAWFKEG